MRKAIVALVACSLLFVSGCVGAPRQTSVEQPSSPGAMPQQDQARAVASEVASAVVANDAATLYGLMEPAFRAEMSLEAAKPTIDRIIMYGGKPVDAVFKQEESGTRASTSGTQPLLTYWYLLSTSGGAQGPYYLKVDVVAEGGSAVVAMFSVVNFPVNGPPDSLK